jgi:hypothetical protein
MLRRFALDVDGPLIHDNWRLRGFFAFLREEGTECDYELFTATGHWRQAVPNMTRPEISAAWVRYVLGKNVADVPTPGAITALASFKNVERIIATARTGSEQAATMQFLHHHYGQFHTCHFELDCKIAVAQKAHVFIDDNIGIVNNVAEHAHDCQIVILFPTPGISRRDAQRRVIILEAERAVGPEMNHDQWHRTCEQAWKEISTILCLTHTPA